MAVAVGELDLSPDEFWELTWYDWSLYLHRLEVRSKDRKLREELEWDRTRALMAFIANQNPYRSKNALPAKPTDFIKLSFDKEEKTTRKTPEEVIKKFGQFKDPDK